MTKLIYVTQLG